jgi:hypothetical protein
MGGRVPLTTTGTSAECQAPTRNTVGLNCGAAHAWRARMRKPHAPSEPMLAAIWRGGPGIGRRRGEGVSGVWRFGKRGHGRFAVQQPVHHANPREGP